jgi:hypothetical protein
MIEFLKYVLEDKAKSRLGFGFIIKFSRNTVEMLDGIFQPFQVRVE